MRSVVFKWVVMLTLAGGCLTAAGCEKAFKDVKLPSLADAPEKLGAPKR